MKDKLTKSTTFICILLVGICLIGVITINAINNINTNDDGQIIEDNNEDIIEIVPYTDYDWNNLISDEQALKYEDDNYYSMFGIDVAAHQDVIDWDKVAQDGVEFAYIRLGYRGALEGKLNIDEQFEYNYENATKAGLKVGIYWYSQPVDELEATAEADFVLKVLNGRHIDLPIAYDFEETMFANDISRIHGMSKNDCTAVALAFCTQMKNNGYDTLLYTNAYWAMENYDWTILDDYPIWFAQYDVEYPKFDRPIVMWQYSDNGYIDGIKRNCDLNILFIKKNG